MEFYSREIQIMRQSQSKNLKQRIKALDKWLEEKKNK